MSQDKNVRERIKSQADAGAGAGLSEPAGLDKKRSKHNGPYENFLMVIFVLFFVSVCIGTHSIQILASPLYFIDKPRYYSCMAMTKQLFGIFVNTLTRSFCPTVVRISGDSEVLDQITVTDSGRLETRFPNRLILIANHIIYTDWLYMWWIAYTSHMHGHIYIVLKESLRYVPVIGPAMMFYGFIFMARNWAKDQARLEHRLHKLNTDANDPSTGKGLNPMWLLLFPEGTNLSDNGRNASKRWADKQGIKDVRHCLLPRSTGMQFCLEQLEDTVDWVYDCTVQYEGIPPGQYGQDIYTLRSIYFQGNAPQSVNMYWRRFATKDIPIDDKDKFNAWLQARWQEKDALLEQYAQTGRFPPNEMSAQSNARKPLHFETTVQPRGIQDYLVLLLSIAIGVAVLYAWFKIIGAALF